MSEQTDATVYLKKQKRHIRLYFSPIFDTPSSFGVI